MQDDLCLLNPCQPVQNCTNKSSAVAEMGDRGHNRHGCCAPFAGVGPRLLQCGLGRGLLPHQAVSVGFNCLWSPYVIGQTIIFSCCLWSPYVIGQTIIFSSCFFLSFCLSFFFFPRLISAVGDWMSTILRHMVWS